MNNENDINNTPPTTAKTLLARLDDLNIPYSLHHHPLDNSMTIGVSPENLLKFVESCGHTPHIIDLSVAAPDTTL